MISFNLGTGVWEYWDGVFYLIDSDLDWLIKRVYSLFEPPQDIVTVYGPDYELPYELQS